MGPTFRYSWPVSSDSSSDFPLQVGPYRLRELLGRGGMGEVFAAVDERLDRRVALKHVPAASEDAVSLKRFRREAKVAAQLSHPSIVQIFDVIEDPSGVWVVMELIEGPSLAAVIERGPVPLVQGMRLARQIAEGLLLAHQKGVVHRDLKAENVMIGAGGHAKILDFGLAKRVAPLGTEGHDLSTLDDSLTGQGVLMGTVRCMSPEQARGYPVDHRSDLFSFGVMLYELFTGRTPFRADTHVDTLTRVITHFPPTLGSLRPDAPITLSTLVERLMAKAPEQRPERTEEVVSIFQGLERHVLAREPGPGAEDRRLQDPSAGQSPPTQPGHGAPISTGLSGTSYDDETLTGAPVVEHDPQAPRDTAQQPATPAGESGRPPRRPAKSAVLAASVLLALAAGQAYVSSHSGNESPPVQNTPVQNNPVQNTPDRAPLDTVQLYQQGMEHLRRTDKAGRVDQAIASFQKALELDPRHPASNAGLSRAYAEKFLNQSRDPIWLRHAETFAELAIEYDDHLAAGYLARAVVRGEQNRFKDAEADFARALSIAPGKGEVLYRRARMFLGQNELNQAETDLLDARATGFDTRALNDTLGLVYFRQSRLDDAAEAFKRAIELAPDSFVGYRNLSSVRYSQGDLQAAAELLQQALELRPSITLYSNLGTLFFTQGRYNDAAKAYQKALETTGGGKLPLLWANLGDAYRFVPGKEDEAQQAFGRAAALWRQALEQDPDDLSSRTQLILALAKSGQGQSFDDHLERLDISLLSHRQLYRLAVAEEIAGRRSTALGRLKQALDAGFSASELANDPELTDLRADRRFDPDWLGDGP